MLRDIVILAGGFGTRLHAVSKGRPKPLVPVVGERLFLDYVFDWVGTARPNRVILSLHHQADLFLKFVSERSFPFRVCHAVEAQPLGTGGAVGYAVEQLRITEPFLVVNGDTYVDFAIDRFHAAFERELKPAMIALAKVSDAGRYGRVEFDGNRATTFAEKTVSEAPGWINSGCYLLSPALFGGRTGAYSIERDIFPKLCADRALAVHTTAGAFFDIGVPEDYNRFVAFAECHPGARPRRHGIGNAVGEKEI